MATFSNAPFIKYTKLSPNNSGLRKHTIDTITIHCLVGHCSLETIGNIFFSPSREACSNYAIDDYGNVGLYCEEKNRSWCSGGYDKYGKPILVNGISGSDNDQRAITIEVASDTTAPYAITDKAMEGLIRLCSDICKRNNIKSLLWKSDKSLVGKIDKQNLTVHRWFANKNCPGDYIYNKLGYIAQEVNKLLVMFEPYLVKIMVPSLNFYKIPNLTGVPLGMVKKNEVYTIIEESCDSTNNKWGKLKSGAGWILLSSCLRK